MLLVHDAYSPVYSMYRESFQQISFRYYMACLKSYYHGLMVPYLGSCDPKMKQIKACRHITTKYCSGFKSKITQ